MFVITTPTGQIGGQVVDRVLDAGHPVRLIARDPGRLSPEVRERVEVVQGSHTDPGVLMAAFAGAEGVFWVIPPDHRTVDLERHYLDPTRSACEALVANGVDRVVSVSTMGRGIEKNAGHLSAARAAEELIAATGVKSRALRPPFFMENLLRQVDAIKSRGTFFLPSDRDRTLALVATRDIAARGAELLLDGSWSGQGGVPVVSPDSLTPDGMAEVVSEVLERTVRYQQLPLDAYKSMMLDNGASEASAQGVADMAVAQNEGAYDEEHRTARPSPTGFRQWCEEVLRPAVLA
ncbi:NmrA family NAD(P)-binding protein [Streptomyces panaciradicis]|uniref:NmrA family NAD(P)-binding protein n=1 Tax=Streptomyces panaciradicis TaxID=1470261 RepID=UPI00201CCA04|nr:NAD(P)H-binding protein [Streptomyces panaciradicis]MCL6675244.1 NAD(P)H-binding protein [Streptomyces panaciradicis]